MDNIGKNILRAISPFACWIALQSLLPTTAWAYAVRTLATTAIGLAAFSSKASRPLLENDLGGTGHPFMDAFIAIAAGLMVCLLWIAPDDNAWYRIWLCWPIGSLPEVPASSPYDPAVCGWALAVVKLVGSAFVIAPVEEVFFRSFLYRWLQKRDFTAVPRSRFDMSAFLWTVFLFMLEHDRPLVAALAGAVYGLLAIRLGICAAIIAHVTTNLALGMHVIYHGQWGFW